MAEDKIELVLNIKARGASGVTNEVKKLTGTAKDLDDELKRLSSTAGGFGNRTRQQIAALRAAFAQLNAEAKAAGRTLTKVEGSGIGTKFARLAATNKDTGSQLQAQRDQIAAIRAAHAEALALDRQRDRELRQQIRSRAQFQRNLDRTIATSAATAGFVGVDAVNTFGKLLDPVRAKGLFASTFSSIGGILGGVFGNAFSDIFSKVGDFLGKLGESIIDGFIAPFRIAIKGIQGLLTGIFISVIGAFNPLNLLVGLFSGIVNAVISIFTQLVSEVTNIVTNLISGLGSLISAGLKLIITIFQGFVDFVSNLWKAFWEGLKSVAEFSLNAIKEIGGAIFDQLAAGFNDFVQSQKEATKSFVNISKEGEKTFGSFAAGTEAVRTLGNEFRRQFGVSSADAQAAIFDVLSGGFENLADAQKIVGAAGKIGAIGQDDLKESTKAVASTLLAYGKTSTDAEKVAAILSETAKIGRFDLPEFNKALAGVINSAATANVPLEEVGAAIATISLSGVPASEAATGLNRLLLAMTNPTKNNAKAFKEMGVELTTVNAQGRLVAKPFTEIIKEFAKIDPTKLRKAFGTVEGIRAFNALNNNAQKFTENLKKIRPDTDQVNKDFENVSNTFDFMFRKLQQIGLIIREDLAGGLLSSSLGGLLGPLIPEIEKLGKALEGSNIKEFFKNLGDFVKPIIDAIINPLVDGVRALTGFVGSADFSKIFKSETLIAIRDTIVNIIKYLTDFKARGNDIVKIYNSVKETFQQIASFASTIFSNLFDPEKFNKLVDFLFESIKLIGIFLLETLKDAFTIAINFISTNIGPRIAEGIRSGLQSLFGTLGTFFGNQAVKFDKKKQEADNNEDAAGSILNAGLASGSTALAQLFGGLREQFNPKITSDEFQTKAEFSGLKELFNNLFLKSNFLNNRDLQGQLQGQLGLDKRDISLLVDLIKGNSSIEGAAKAGPFSKEQITQFLDTAFNDLLSAGGIPSVKQQPGLANGFADAVKEIRILAEQLRGQGALDSSVGSFGPNFKSRFGNLKTSLGDLANKTFGGDDSAVLPPQLPEGVLPTEDQHLEQQKRGNEALDKILKEMQKSNIHLEDLIKTKGLGETRGGIPVGGGVGDLGPSTLDDISGIA